MFDLGDNHKADVHAVHVPCKLNLAACIIRMSELGEPLDAGALDQVPFLTGARHSMWPLNYLKNSFGRRQRKL
jgi:hypothetical protein